MATAYANLEKQIPADERSVYRVASITKLFTSTMMMLLRDAGKLNLDDPLEKYLPEFKIKSPFADARPPTFRMIASHAAGLAPRRRAGRLGRRGTCRPSRNCWRRWQVSEMHMPTMTEPKYSNLGIAILGYALGQNRWAALRDVRQGAYFQPLGMIDSGFERDHMATITSRSATTQSGRCVMKPAPDWDAIGFRPAGGMYSTVADISKFIALQFTRCPGQARPAARFSAAAPCARCTCPSISAPDFESGFGLALRAFSASPNRKSSVTAAAFPATPPTSRLIPALKLAMVVFTNTEPIRLRSATKCWRCSIAGFPASTRRAARDCRADRRWKPYLGRYAWALMDDVLEIRMLNGHLTALTVGEDPSTYVTPDAQR